MASEESTAGKRISRKGIAVGLAVLLLVGGGAAWYAGLFPRRG
jgi:hypothetical protein